ncbi:carbohydrate sulfotransferase 6 [Xenopus laevis]|uniref:Carbohydrate sulfotransferase 6 n=2 Tax=Xenopus laevis TaxID=8355 RepID=A0A1L8GKM2_XENLA|nr:carbohydrate sulfotransferase 6 [Xenopus laevis]OCT84398.1 hypothetical protein XELAEV_18022551mg [Xenopus laevis]
MARMLTTITVLFVAQTFLLLLHFWRNNLPSNKEEKTHLLILSSWRSGSSVVGHIFNQHPDVFFLNEPAWHVWVSMFHNDADMLQMSVRDVLRSVFRCEISVFDAYIQEARKMSNLFMWATSRALCSLPACDAFPRNEITNEMICKRLCAKYPFDRIEETCKSYNHLVIKEFRLFDIKVLYSLLTDYSLNLKIIHLVRDPRAIGNSREQVAWALTRDNKIVLKSTGRGVNDSFSTIMSKICQSHARMYKTVASSSSIFLKNRYMLVRYEDVVRQPVREMRRMYEFANLKPNTKLEQWIYKITHGEGTGKKKEKYEITPRDADKVSKAWRHILAFKKLKLIQDACGEAMATFGYRFMHSIEQQRNQSMDFVLPKPQF